MDQVRRRLTFANVVSLSALFVALGGTAMASVIITSNSQVAQNTISGHHTSSGKHPNIILGSVNGQDIQDLQWQTLTLKNGWVANCNGDSSPPQLAKSVEGVVYFRGDMCRTSGDSDNPFTVPQGLIPGRRERIAVSMCVGRAGRLEIGTNGEVTVLSASGGTGDAACYTSLAGANYTLPY